MQNIKKKIEKCTVTSMWETIVHINQLAQIYF